MAGITNYSQNQFQYFYKRVAKPSGASGTEIKTWAVSGVSGMSDISSTSPVSGASGFTVEQLSFNEVIELFTTGNLTVGEVEKWLKANNIKFEFSDNGKIVNFKFMYDKKSYDISCNKKAAESQLDNVTQDTYYKSQIDSLKEKYKLDDKEISKYFLVGTSYNSNVSMYIINPECGCDSWSEVVDTIKAEKEQNTKGASSSRKAKQSSQIDEEVENFFNSVKGRTFESIEEFKAVCGDLVNRFNIEQVYSQGNSKYYKVELKGTNQGISVTVDSAKATLQKIEQLFKDVNNGTFNSLDEFKQTCGDLFSQLNIEPVYSNSDYTYYKVTVNGLASMETTIKVEKEHNISDATSNNTINIDELFGGLDSIDSKYLVENYKNWKNSSDPNIRQLYDIVEEKLKELGIEKFEELENKFEAYDRRCFFDALIKLINDKVGLPNAQPPEPLTLTKEAIEKLNQIGSLNTIAEILKPSQTDPITDKKELTAFDKEYYTGSIDGVIGAFGQGKKIGDCTILATLISLNATKQGQKFIDDAITDNGDGTYTVKFKEHVYNNQLYPKWSDTFTIDDIIKARQSGVYSSGDVEVLLFEIAYEKCMLEQTGSNMEQYGSGSAINKAGDFEESLTGYINPQFGDGLTSLKTLEYNYNHLKNGNAIFYCEFNNVIVKDTNLNEIRLHEGHAYSIVDFDKDSKTITIVDPYSTEPIVLSWDVFASANQDKPLHRYFNSDSISVDDVFEPFINGDINVKDLLSNIADLRSLNVFSAKDKEYIIEKCVDLAINEQMSTQFVNVMSQQLKLEPEELINIYVKIYAQTSNSDIKNSIIDLIYRVSKEIAKFDNSSMKFTFDGKTYEVYNKFDSSNPDNKHEIYAPYDITKYTNNKELINKYFEVAASVDGEPLIYRLKDGVSYEYFLAEAGVKTEDSTFGPYIHVKQNEIDSFISDFKNGTGSHAPLGSWILSTAEANGVTPDKIEIIDIECVPVILEENEDGTVNFELKVNIVYKINE